jgi:hypothetical protein
MLLNELGLVSTLAITGNLRFDRSQIGTQGLGRVSDVTIRLFGGTAPP